MSGLEAILIGAAHRSSARARAVACWLALAACASLPALAQSNAPQMRLRVVDADTGQPVPAVKVRAWAPAKPTDSLGVGMIPLPKPGLEDFNYRITLSKPGYVGQYITWSKAQQDKLQDIPVEFTARLEKGVEIGGIVKNDKGDPVPDARVILSGPMPLDFRARVRSVVSSYYHTEQTDAQGKWQFAEAPRALENLTFHVLQSEYVAATFACEGSTPGTRGVSLLPKADFLAGKAVMTLGHGIELSGRVVDSAGHPVAGAAITRNHEWRNLAASLSADTDGRFIISNLSGGELSLTIQAKGLAAQTRLLKLSHGMPELKIEMAPGKMFQGRVVDPSGKGVAGAAVQMDRPELGPLEYDWNASTDSQGRFCWDSAPEGAHPYFFSRPGYHPRNEPGLVADGTEHVITLRPRTDGDKTMVDGRVVDAASKEPVRNFTVYVKEITGRDASHFQQTVSNVDGCYTMPVHSAAAAYIISIGTPGYRLAAAGQKSPGDGDVRLDFALKRSEEFP
jgi:protocatechuate 3,4-dioxygenase beta subunit